MMAHREFPPVRRRQSVADVQARIDRAAPEGTPQALVWGVFLRGVTAGRYGLRDRASGGDGFASAELLCIADVIEGLAESRDFLWQGLRATQGGL